MLNPNIRELKGPHAILSSRALKLRGVKTNAGTLEFGRFIAGSSRRGDRSSRVVRLDGRKMKLYHLFGTVVVSTNPIDAYTVLPVGL